jgi:hypothetical protein
VDKMLTKNTQMNRDQIEMIALEQLVPTNHLVRKIEAAIDFSFIYSLVQDMYSSERGRPSIDIDKDGFHSICLRYSLYAPTGLCGC